MGVRLGGARGLERRTRRGIRRLLDTRLATVAFYDGRARTLDALPIVDKATVRERFVDFNVPRVTLEQALAHATDAEERRDFRDELPGGITVGLSSGTSGRPGVFLVSERERMLWAGTVLGRLLDSVSVRQLVTPWARPVRIAFALRANSTLYEAVTSRRLRFGFVDLVAPFDEVRAAVQRVDPDVLVAPSTVLGALAKAALETAEPGALHITPRLVIAVAEVLDDDTAALVLRAWGVRPRRVYQATEGLLALDCAHGNLHLNERHVHVEPEWLDLDERRFSPIVTDLTRTTQLVVRYRLDDVLRVPAEPVECPCGDPSLVLEAVEGRADETIVVADGRGGEASVFPDAVRRALAVAGASDWSIRWGDGALELALRDDRRETRTAAEWALERLFETLRLPVPEIVAAAWRAPEAGAKTVRIRRKERADV
ncbi:F390 synthetase-related protein [Agromyces protaetiae]|uniref:F390 synthetase-related protein n=1 Tax=Agromyces protaetiae TaxID=2509455 RepID=UPI0013EC6EF4|nr:F390 synthetase-related protein [Agromyces protaetiae]